MKSYFLSLQDNGKTLVLKKKELQKKKKKKKNFLILLKVKYFLYDYFSNKFKGIF